MADKDTPKLSDGLERYIKAVTAAGAKRDGKAEAEMAAQFSAAPYSYLIVGFPCPQFSHLNPASPTPGGSLDVYFYPDTFDLDHSVSITDTTVMNPVTRTYTDKPTAGSPSPFKITIPAKDGGNDNFVAGHSYMLALYPSFYGLPVGCITWIPVAVGTPELTRAVFAAIQLRPPIATLAPKKAGV